MTRDIPKIIFFCICAIIAGVFLAKQVKADGYGPGQGGYKDEPAEYRYSHRPQKVSYGRRYVADCDPHLTKYECRRFREKMAERANGSRRPRYAAATVSRRYEREERYYDRPVRRKRYAETRYVRSDADYRGRNECLGVIKATSKPTLTMRGAEKEAKRNWSMAVAQAYSGAYNNVNIARVVALNCKPIHYGAWRSMCTFIARPCRED